MKKSLIFPTTPPTAFYRIWRYTQGLDSVIRQGEKVPIANPNPVTPSI